ncbi:Selenocysteine lyase/Cysteine desulfurase [Cohaesibacter sp. ES.047]|uniref:aminotransferase class V-fold PLP-dependent enzyme n=1 Tax=Cohaesibacter sp. ES.047 TaxID=1798205 RepID=UPI000BB7A0F8|nr:aminotransferase class V-fold PLP-dependent enzyme [Cohaesibacter sp. ES.047]SNY90448.1 Selenocysteine lyase/Cysteine desulfurase [Cohaesibacter sp. ES.047]
MDIKKIRAETPGIAHGIHLLACGSALAPRPVVDAVMSYLDLEARIGGYEAHAQEAQMLDATYGSVARLIGAKPHEIAILENATVAWCQAFYALPLKKGDRIITCQAEYAANYVAYLHRQKTEGIEIDIVPNDETGALDLTALETMITERTALISITWVPTNGGLVNPAVGVGAIAKKHGIPYLLDACQAVGQMPVDVEALQCDFLSATGRKFLRGPRGTGFLYIRETWLESLEPASLDHFSAPLVDSSRYAVRADARRFETWENSYALRAGLKVACDYAMDIGLDAIQQRAWMLAADLREKLVELPGCSIMDLGAEKCAIVSFTIDGLDPQFAVNSLREKGIAIGMTNQASSLLDAERRNLPVMLRISPHYYNNESDLDACFAALEELV